MSTYERKGGIGGASVEQSMTHKSPTGEGSHHHKCDFPPTSLSPSPRKGVGRALMSA